MSNCIFCKIITGDAPAEILYQDDDVTVFKDIKPAARFHFLCISKEHIANVNSLTKAHEQLVEQLVSNGKQVLADKGGDVNDVLLGFHLPPFNSISHLHLHVISPATQMSLINRMIFRPNSWWFASAEQILDKVGSSKL